MPTVQQKDEKNFKVYLPILEELLIFLETNPTKTWAHKGLVKQSRKDLGTMYVEEVLILMLNHLQSLKNLQIYY